jgi:tetratricopeptide (TPR) repeat protein
MHTKRHTLAWLLFLISIVPGLAFAEREGRLVGKVTDPQGNPIPGVVVTATSPQIPGFRDVQTTDKRGVFVVDFYKIDVTYNYRFDKAGYQSMEAQQKWTLEGTEHYQWTMRAGQTAAVVGGQPPASTSQEAILAYNTGITAFKAKDYATAEAKLKEAVGHDPNMRQAWGALSSAHQQLGHHKEAAEAAEKAIASARANGKSASFETLFKQALSSINR